MNAVIRTNGRGLAAGLLDPIHHMDRMMSHIFDGLPSWQIGGGPAVDIREEADRYVMEAELPGLTEKDVEVKVENNLLTLSSRQAAENSNEAKGYVIRERRNVAFSRSFVLPRDVDREQIAANFRNGLLVLTLHKRPESQPKTIEIKVEQ